MSCATLCVALLALMQTGSEPSARAPHELRAAIHFALRNSAPTAQPDPRQVTPGLVALYDEVRADTRLDPHDRLKFLGLLRTRLMDTSKELTAIPPVAPRAKSVDLPNDRQQRDAILAQQGFAAGAAGQQGAGGGGNAAGGAPRDHSQELIDSIQRTIAPTTWDVAGGQGTIRYYRPLHVLVIRQTGEVHGRVGGAHKGLRK